ncbi:hypothetical protein GKZ89_09765 [Bacillus mangrovi]|uniref:DNA-binding protein n=1 Tax=Metabacillus mangrovi TaxID=1491830 RepID=A0A7X2S4W2_9BACI|nr:hypothetical protein [Metabacillus mangrovi]MTH53689.1 hypothetical protein [Metabacillus mangrovi]
MEIRITEKDIQIYDKIVELDLILKDEYGIKPVQIGQRLGKTSYDAAGYLNPSLKKLIQLQAIVKTCRGHYKPVIRVGIS